MRYFMRPPLAPTGYQSDMRHFAAFLCRCCFAAFLLAQGLFSSAHATPFERTEEREPCADFDVHKQAFFGDLHVHTSYSHDSYVSNQRNDPVAAYRYAQGATIVLPDAFGEQEVQAKLSRPLDFTAVTDHGEYLGLVDMCTGDPWRLGYWWPHCIMTRSDNMWLQLIAANRYGALGGSGGDGHKTSIACQLSDCDASTDDSWRRTQEAAEIHYDRSATCSFSTFVGYEFTDAPQRNNMHRNVIFRNAEVTNRPITTYETGSYNFPQLWSLLREECIDATNGCDVISIPHNPNLSGGMMFRDPESKDEVEDRLFFEPLVEIIQHKASSECRFDRLAGIGLATEDEQCDFEQVTADNLSMLGSVNGEMLTDAAPAVPIEHFAQRNMVRNVLKDGLGMQSAQGVNPFQFGFIGSTDTHSATAGGAEENNFVGHLGWRDSGFRGIQDHFTSNPGGLAVVWAEENSQDSLFNGMKNREAYATSGTRPQVRLFGGAGLEADLCESPDMIAAAYKQGVPMGGELAGLNGAPRFLASIHKDPGTPTMPGTDLQRAQIIKGWVDGQGATQEKVYDVAGDADNGAYVDSLSCQTTGTGAARLCTVWEDPDFDSAQAAFYYLRVLENPTCRWSTLQCQAAGVNPFADDCAAQAQEANKLAINKGAEGDVYANCCTNPAEEPFYTPVIQERAWTSPIWYLPPRPDGG